MPKVFPFRAIQYALGRELSNVVAPPYDVLDAMSKQRLLAKDPRNVVAIDLPHTPAKELGPPGAYDSAAALLREHLSAGVLKKSDAPVMFAYRQTFWSEDGSRTIQRSGMTCCVETVAFGPRAGGGILPHEETFSGPKEDRMALMKATRTQMSPIFGLHADDSGRATALLHKVMSSRGPDTVAKTDDGTLHELWTITDSSTLKSYQDALEGEDVFIADGHHRYTTGLNYLKGLEASEPVAADHPARRCMIVLVGMSDPGLVIWPTHRVLGGMKGYSPAAFLAASAGQIQVEPATGDLGALDRALAARSDLGERRFALYDFAGKQGWLATPMAADPLGDRFPDKPRAWRDLTVAFTQYVIVEQICQPVLNAGQPVKWAFPHTIREVEEIGRGGETGAGGGAGFAQLAVIVRPTPLQAVREVSRANQLMPQKSTFFYPKLATGLFMNGLEARD
ncbi:hypothetical protein PHYC_00423 [Phycisphaerales bacterium]|nr:hypothetical protein PHYC_00423 [Phycisphaerales bacterium]